MCALQGAWGLHSSTALHRRADGDPAGARLGALIKESGGLRWPWDWSLLGKGGGKN